MTKKEIKAENDKRRSLHYEQLWSMLGGSKTISASTLQVSLRRWETKLGYHNEVLCNRSSKYSERQVEKIEGAVKTYLAKNFAKGKNFVKRNIFFNHDPRGYAIKFEWKNRNKHLRRYNRINCDWGGYGILAPSPDCFFY